MNETAMRCDTYAETKFLQMLQQEKARPVFEAIQKEQTGVVQFELEIPDFDHERDKQTLLFIDSPKIGAFVYAGPLTTRFSILMDSRLKKDGGGDSLTYIFYRPAKHQICVQAQQVGEPYWQPGATAKVKFLRERYIDKTTGVPISFEVEIKKP